MTSAGPPLPELVARASSSGLPAHAQTGDTKAHVWMTLLAHFFEGDSTAYGDAQEYALVHAQAFSRHSTMNPNGVESPNKVREGHIPRPRELKALTADQYKYGELRLPFFMLGLYDQWMFQALQHGKPVHFVDAGCGLGELLRMLVLCAASDRQLHDRFITDPNADCVSVLGVEFQKRFDADFEMLNGVFQRKASQLLENVGFSKEACPGRFALVERKVKHVIGAAEEHNYAEATHVICNNRCWGPAAILSLARAIAATGKPGLQLAVTDEFDPGDPWSASKRVDIPNVLRFTFRPATYYSGSLNLGRVDHFFVFTLGERSKLEVAPVRSLRPRSRHRAADLDGGGVDISEALRARGISRAVHSRSSSNEIVDFTSDPSDDELERKKHNVTLDKLFGRAEETACVKEIDPKAWLCADHIGAGLILRGYRRQLEEHHFCIHDPADAEAIYKKFQEKKTLSCRSGTKFAGRNNVFTYMNPSGSHWLSMALVHVESPEETSACLICYDPRQECTFEAVRCVTKLQALFARDKRTLHVVVHKTFDKHGKPVAYQPWGDFWSCGYHIMLNANSWGLLMDSLDSQNGVLSCCSSYLTARLNDLMAWTFNGCADYLSNFAERLAQDFRAFNANPTAGRAKLTPDHSKRLVGFPPNIARLAWAASIDSAEALHLAKATDMYRPAETGLDTEFLLDETDPGERCKCRAAHDPCVSTPDTGRRNGPDCTNVLSGVQCTAYNCSNVLEANCGNRFFRRVGYSPSISVIIAGRPSNLKASVHPAEPVKKGTIVAEVYGGLWETSGEGQKELRVSVRRATTHETHVTFCHVTPPSEFPLLDSGWPGLCRRALPNEKPNLRMEKRLVFGKWRLCLVATNDIPPDTQLLLPRGQLSPSDAPP